MRRSSSLHSIDSHIERNVGNDKYQDVVTVADNIESIIVLADSIENIGSLEEILGNKAEKSTTINTIAPLSGGGDLSEDRTLSVATATTSSSGVVQLNDTLISDSSEQALTAAQGKILQDSKIGSISAGTNIIIDNTDSINPIISAIPSTSAGLLTRLYATGDVVNLNSINYYLALQDDEGTVTSVTQTISVDDNQKLYYNQDFITNATTEDTLYSAGSYSGFINVQSSEGVGSVKFTVEVYLADINGSVIDSGIVSEVVGDLGVKPLSILDTGVISLENSNITQIPLSGALSENYIINTGNRIRFHISAEKIGTDLGIIDLTLYTGSDNNSYVDIPIAATTDTVINKSDVLGATASDALDSLNSRLSTVESDYWNSTNDGSGSGLDADTLDGQEGSYYYPASNPDGYTDDQTPSEILTAIKTVDGSGSGLDADTLDGNHAAAFSLADHDHSGIYEPVDSTILRDSDIGITIQSYDSNTTIQGNIFNGVDQLVKLDGTGKLPAIDGSQLTNLPSGFSDPMTTRGDIIIRDINNITSRLGVGTNGQVLGTDGVDVFWSNSVSTGLEKLTDDGGSTYGWRLVGRDSDNYGDIGSNAIDFSTSTSISTTYGATGNYSFAEGYLTTAFGNYSHVEGISSVALGSASHAEGSDSTATGNYSHAEGEGTIALNTGSHTAGRYNIGTSVDTIHETGIGIDNSNRANAFEIYFDGTLTAPEATTALIDSRGVKSIVTKEWVENKAYLVSTDITNMLETSDIGVTVQGYDADTAKTDVAQTFTAPQRTSITAEDNTIDFTSNNNFSLTATAANITVSSLTGCTGQEGVITIASAENITGWGTEFVFKNVPTGLSGTERFAYFVESETVIAIGRVQ